MYHAYASWRGFASNAQGLKPWTLCGRIGGRHAGRPAGGRGDRPSGHGAAKTGGTYSSKRKEDDIVEWRTGVSDGRTTGEPIEVHIANSDARSSDYSFLPDHPRPGHQDMVMMKRTDGEADLRGGGTSSARMTAPLVAVAAVVGGWLKQHGVQVEAHLGAVGDVEAAPMSDCPPLGQRNMSTASMQGPNGRRANGWADRPHSTGTKFNRLEGGPPSFRPPSGPW